MLDIRPVAIYQYPTKQWKFNENETNSWYFHQKYFVIIKYFENICFSIHINIVLKTVYFRLLQKSDNVRTLQTRINALKQSNLGYVIFVFNVWVKVVCV